jgi:ABC-type Zn2+ transport system substrate-binding protein/surface adhesin
MLKRFSYYLLSVVFVAGMVACGGKSHDHLDHDHDHEHAEETEHHDHDSEDHDHNARGAHTDEIILSPEKARAAGTYGRKDLSDNDGYEQNRTDELQPCHWRNRQGTDRTRD